MVEHRFKVGETVEFTFKNDGIGVTKVYATITDGDESGYGYTTSDGAFIMGTVLHVEPAWSDLRHGQIYKIPTNWIEVRVML